MEAREKRKLERAQQVESRRTEICEAALEEFIEKGIDRARIEDIARRAEVGPATVYRYFENKQNLAVECAAGFWSSQVDALLPEIEKVKKADLSGYEQVAALLQVVGGLYHTNPIWLRLLEQFDNYVVREKIPRELLTEYENSIFRTQNILLDAIWAGQKDGTIRKDLDGRSFCVTTTHAITALSQKLLLRGDVLQSDAQLNAETQLRMLVGMALSYIRV